MTVVHRQPGVGSAGTGSAASGPAPPPAASVLFTAFEPSGDNLAAPVIAALRRLVPQVRIYAWGGPRMADAGATIVQATAEDGSMGLGALAKVMAVRREVARVRRWAKQYRVVAHVPVDSPAANFPICKVTRKAGARIVHLVAPQLWAWGGWRIGKLRRLTDLVLCLLPFEEQWFKERGVEARFIGHPTINRMVEMADLRERMHGLPHGAPRIAIFPGSRSQEVRANIRLLADAFTELQARHAGLAGVVVAANPKLAKIVRNRIKVFPTGLHMTTVEAPRGTLGQAGSPAVDAAIAWCDLALAVSGTISLDIALQRKPMVAVYRTGWVSWLFSNLILRLPLRLLPNIVAEREIVPEFVPHAGGCMPLVKAANTLLHDSRNAAVMSEELHRVCLRFSNHQPAEEAARAILGVIRAQGTEQGQGQR